MVSMSLMHRKPEQICRRKTSRRPNEPCSSALIDCSSLAIMPCQRANDNYPRIDCAFVFHRRWKPSTRPHPTPWRLRWLCVDPRSDSVLASQMPYYLPTQNMARQSLVLLHLKERCPCGRWMEKTMLALGSASTRCKVGICPFENWLEVLRPAWTTTFFSAFYVWFDTNNGWQMLVVIDCHFRFEIFFADKSR